MHAKLFGKKKFMVKPFFPVTWHSIIKIKQAVNDGETLMPLKWPFFFLKKVTLTDELDPGNKEKV